MRPLDNNRVISSSNNGSKKSNGLIKVLFVSGQISEPEEVVPYLEALMKVKEFSVYLTFRPYRDGFEKKLRAYDPHIIDRVGKENTLRGDINDDIAKCDIVVGPNSTAVLEALLQLKPIIFFNTGRWGDYFDLRNYLESSPFFAENPNDLIKKIKKAHLISKNDIKKLLERFFGDPYKNGSKWVVDQMENVLLKESIK